MHFLRTAEAMLGRALCFMHHPYIQDLRHCRAFYHRLARKPDALVLYFYPGVLLVYIVGISSIYATFGICVVVIWNITLVHVLNDVSRRYTLYAYTGGNYHYFFYSRYIN